MYETACVTHKLQMSPVRLQQFLPNLQNWTSVNQLLQAQLASSKRMEIWQTLWFTNKSWNERDFEYGFKIIHNLHEGQQNNTHLRFLSNASRYIIGTTPFLLLFIPYIFLVRMIINFRIAKEKERGGYYKAAATKRLSFFFQWKLRWKDLMLHISKFRVQK